MAKQGRTIERPTGWWVVYGAVLSAEIAKMPQGRTISEDSIDAAVVLADDAYRAGRQPRESDYS